MAVLQRKELEASPLADLHAIASELGLEGFRAMRKADLIGAILAAQGGEPEPEPRPSRGRAGRGPPEAPRPRSPRRTSEARRGHSEDDEGPRTTARERARARRRAPPRALRRGGAGGRRGGARGAPRRRSPPACSTCSPTARASCASIPAGSRAGTCTTRPAQIRRCELRAGDGVSGPVRSPRRNERHPSLIHVETVNGAAGRAARGAALVRRPVGGPPVRAAGGARRAGGVPFGKGSRVAGERPAGRRRHLAAARVAATLAESIRARPAGGARGRAPRGGGRVARDRR